MLCIFNMFFFSFVTLIVKVAALMNQVKESLENSLVEENAAEETS